MVIDPGIRACLVICICLAACTARDPIEGTTPETSGDKGGMTKPSASQPMDIDQQVSFAKAALADRLAVDAGDVQVLAARTVQWRSGATGCPQPGMNYTMAIVPGIQVLLLVDKQIHHYHAGIGREPFYCPAHQAEEPVQGSAEEAM